jgi:HAD superfamily hydrolase (TIGR01509 family)
MKRTTLFLDAGGVLVEPDWTRIAGVLARHGIEADPAALQAAEPRAKRELDMEHLSRGSRGASPASFYYDLVLAQAGVSADPGRAAKAWETLSTEHARDNLWARVPEGAPEGLALLQAAGFRLVVVSNSNGTVRAVLTGVGLASFFHTIVDSEEEGVEKPDPRIFHIALERSGARREATLHVGDLYYVDVAGARAAGIEAWLMDPADLYPEVDCPRVRSLLDLASRLGNGRGTHPSGS